jgi:hypothetical protein
LDKKELLLMQKLIKQISPATPGERFNIALINEKDREQALKFVKNLLIVLRQNLYKKPSQAGLANLRLCQKAIVFLEANLNPKLVVGNLMLGFQA